MLLGRVNLPIMGVNSMTQMMIPPPKYAVDRLVPCRIIRDAQVEDVFLISRGAPGVSPIDHGEAVETLLANTDDAYGFPPYRYFAPAIVIGGDGYDELRRKERQILTEALAGVPIRAVSSSNFSWAEDIAGLLRSLRCGYRGGRCRRDPATPSLLSCKVVS